MAAGMQHPGNDETIHLQQQVARLQALLEASRQVHSTIREEEVLEQVLHIVVRELEMAGAAFPGTGLVYGEAPADGADCAPSYPLQDREGRRMAELVVTPPEGRELTLYEADFIEGLALQAAVALENARNHKRNIEYARETGVPVYVAAQRYDAGLLAEAGQSSGVKGSGMVGQGFSPYVNATKTTRALAPEVCIHLLDDGFQHRQLHCDVNILLLDGHDWLEDGLLPAGNLREPLQAARRATVIAIPADNPELEAALRAWGWQGPIWRLHRKMEVPAPPGREAGSVFAFCGIARPEQFFAGLESAGLQIAARLVFPDHHRYTTADLKRLVSAARAAGATALVTTEKDLIRLEDSHFALPKSLPIKTAQLHIEIENQAAAIDWLLSALG